MGQVLTIVFIILKKCKLRHIPNTVFPKNGFISFRLLGISLQVLKS